MMPCEGCLVWLRLHLRAIARARARVAAAYLNMLQRFAWHVVILPSHFVVSKLFPYVISRGMVLLVYGYQQQACTNRRRCFYAIVHGTGHLVI